jgi:hypothetical protein
MLSDFVLLSKAYGSFPIFHEIAIPTMARILERSYSAHPSMSAIQALGDCWGGCCIVNPEKEDILDHRCGHKFDFRDWENAKVHFTRLDENSELLGKPKPWRTAAGAIDMKSKTGNLQRKRDVMDFNAPAVGVGLRDTV